jgi:phasin family protein
MLHCTNVALHNLLSGDMTMTKPQETIELFADLGAKSVDTLRQLGELQMKAWNKVLDQQLDIFNTVLGNASQQFKLMSEAKSLEDTVREQVELNRTLAEDLMGKARKSVELAQKVGEDYRDWAEKASSEAKKQFEAATPKAA